MRNFAQSTKVSVSVFLLVSGSFASNARNEREMRCCLSDRISSFQKKRCANRHRKAAKVLHRKVSNVRASAIGSNNTQTQKNQL